MKHTTGPKILYWGIPTSTVRGEGFIIDCNELTVRVEEFRKPVMNVVLFATGSKVGKSSTTLTVWNARDIFREAVTTSSFTFRASKIV